MRIVVLLAIVYLASVHAALVKRSEGIPVSGKQSCNLLGLARRDSARAANLLSSWVSLRSAVLLAEYIDLDRLEAPIQEQETASSNDTSFALSALSSVPATNQAVYYTVQVQLGDQWHEMMLDTGSSVSWVKNYSSSNTTTYSNAEFATRYGLGSIEGQIIYDTLHIGDMTVSNQGIGAISNSVDMDVNGLLGLGPAELAQGTFTSGVVVSTVMETLLAQAQIEEAVFQLGLLVSLPAVEADGEIRLSAYE